MAEDDAVGTEKDSRNFDDKWWHVKPLMALNSLWFDGSAVNLSICGVFFLHESMLRGDGFETLVVWLHVDRDENHNSGMAAHA